MVGGDSKNRNKKKGTHTPPTPPPRDTSTQIFMSPRAQCSINQKKQGKSPKLVFFFPFFWASTTTTGHDHQPLSAPSTPPVTAIQGWQFVFMCRVRFVSTHEYSAIQINTNPTCLLNRSRFLNPNMTRLLNGSIVSTCLLDFIEMKKKIIKKINK